ncbi:MAG: hypothetical protein CMF23_12380 [Ignavibacteriae bacterium]|nr:hypothetical protein [Ignavibacteriota bacterium]
MKKAILLLLFISNFIFAQQAKNNMFFDGNGNSYKIMTHSEFEKYLENYCKSIEKIFYKEQSDYDSYSDLNSLYKNRIKENKTQAEQYYKKNELICAIRIPVDQINYQAHTQTLFMTTKRIYTRWTNDHFTNKKTHPQVNLSIGNFFEYQSGPGLSYFRFITKKLPLSKEKAKFADIAKNKGDIYLVIKLSYSDSDFFPKMEGISLHWIVNNQHIFSSKNINSQIGLSAKMPFGVKGRFGTISGFKGS